MIKIGLSKHLNEEFLDSMKVAHAIYNIRKKIDNKIRVPLMALIKYKGLKVLVKAVTPCDFMS
jgi:4-hydroxy-3-methylbut-2-en-1-yl diphosphate synthase IspG/GcpE